MKKRDHSETRRRGVSWAGACGTVSKYAVRRQVDGAARPHRRACQISLLVSLPPCDLLPNAPSLCTVRSKKLAGHGWAASSRGMRHDRIYPRMRATTKVDWCVTGAATHVVSNLGNLSPGGAFVHTSIPPPVGSALERRVLTEVGAVATQGRVAWSGPAGMGVSFDG